MQFSNPHIYATTTTLRGTWPGMVSSEAQAMVHNHRRGQSIPNSFAVIYSDENKMFPFLQENGPKVSSQTTPQASMHQPLPNSSIVSTESGRGGHSMLSGGPTQSIDLGYALYLLSSHSAQTSAMDLSHLVRSSVSHPSQSIASQQLDEVSQYSCSHVLKDKSAAGLVLLPDANETNFYCNGVFEEAFDALFESEDSPTLPIW